jgi:hypothetical protein
MSLLGIIASSKKGAAAPVAGYNLWLDASDATTFTFSSGSVVSQWTDKSANAYAFTQATVANQPIRDTTQNSLSTVNFGGGGDRLVSTAASSTWKYLHDGTGATVFIVSRQTAGLTVLSTNRLETNGGPGIVAFYGSGTEFYLDSFPGISGQETYAIATIADETYNVFSGLLDQTNATTANKVKLFLGDGAANTSAGAYSPGTGNPQTTLAIGSIDTGGYSLTGQIAEIITYTSLLSESDRQKNVDYLQGKWGL